WVSAAPIVGAMRARKDAEELDALRRAATAADAALGDLLSEPLAGRTEGAVAATLADLLIEHGHDAHRRRRRTRGTGAGRARGRRGGAPCGDRPRPPGRRDPDRRPGGAR